jgi:hypothetical protein
VETKTFANARQMGAERIIAMSRHEARQRLARAFGAACAGKPLGRTMGRCDLQRSKNWRRRWRSGGFTLEAWLAAMLAGDAAWASVGF